MSNENLGMRNENNDLYFIEQRIITAVRGLLAGRVNELLRGFEFQIPFIEFGIFRGVDVIAPVIAITSCEQTEKERIVRQYTYSISVSFPVLDTVESEVYCFAYADAFNKAVSEDVSLGGIVDHAVISNKKYTPPKKNGCGMEWEAVISLRITVERLYK